MVTKAQQQGTLRPDIDATDISYMQVALASIMEASHDTAPDVYRHHLKVFIDGMRAEGHREPARDDA
ncbi:hypothetical protein AB0M68_19365 [Streptomyces sp. NPDC051453]|uniref:SbtR family transcriptional regulator n=1 Tax=Streptomyces sp. NPDC051453 TaxID=3154941 RepID=UPI003443E352